MLWGCTICSYTKRLPFSIIMLEILTVYSINNFLSISDRWMVVAIFRRFLNFKDKIFGILLYKIIVNS